MANRLHVLSYFITPSAKPLAPKETIRMLTTTVRLYEDNAGGLHMYLVGDTKVICGLFTGVAEEPARFEQDAAEFGSWAHTWEADGNITQDAAEFFEDFERNNGMVHVADYRDGKVEIVGNMGTAAQIYVLGKRTE
jgi:hypothetical protein